MPLKRKVYSLLDALKLGFWELGKHIFWGSRSMSVGVSDLRSIFDVITTFALILGISPEPSN